LVLNASKIFENVRILARNLVQGRGVEMAQSGANALAQSSLLSGNGKKGVCS
jgi:hypothetical protein